MVRRRHPLIASARLSVREAQLIDSMIDLLLETVHKIGVRSKCTVVTGIARCQRGMTGVKRASETHRQPY